MSDASSEVAAKVGQLCQVEWLNEFNEEENFTFRPTVALGDYMHGTYQKSDPAHFTHVSADVVLPKALASHRLSREDKDRIAKAPDPFAVPPEKSPEVRLAQTSPLAPISSLTPSFQLRRPSTHLTHQQRGTSMWAGDVEGVRAAHQGDGRSATSAKEDGAARAQR